MNRNRDRSWVDGFIGRTVRWTPKPLAWPLAKRYVAGTTPESALETVRRLNGEGFRVTLDILGEHVRDAAEAEGAAGAYADLLAAIDREKLDANISVKLTHFGLKLDRDLARRLLADLCRKAAGAGNFVRIDMEDSSCTDDTLAIYRSLREEGIDAVGVVLQACLRRTLDDLRGIPAAGGNVRICKGIYREPRAIAYTDPELVDRNYAWTIEEAFRRGLYVGIATHDERIVWEAFRILDRRGIPRDRYEFQMLLGVDEPLRDMIRDAGHRLRVYVPFGKDWYAYSMRRLQENPKIARYVLANLFRGGDS